MNNANSSVILEHKKATFGVQALIVSLRWVFAVIGVLILSACTSGKVITTVDDSADYQSAASLPPLKKPSRETPSIGSTEPEPESVVDTNVQTSVERDSGNTSLAGAYIPEQVEEPQGEPLKSEEPLAAEELLNASDDLEQAEADTLSARVISPKSDVSRLQIESEFAGAWAYLGRSLQSSDITVFSRNQAAGRFSIGCLGIDSSTTVKKKGGWSFLNKKSTLEQEYCGLQVVATKGATIVTVLNRFNEEIDGESAAKVLSRVLNN